MQTGMQVGVRNLGWLLFEDGMFWGGPPFVVWADVRQWGQC